MKTLYTEFGSFVKVIEFLEENDYDYKWEQSSGGYLVTMK